MGTSEKDFVQQFQGLLDAPEAFATAVVRREFIGYMEQYHIPFAELQNEALVRLWEASKMWEADPVSCSTYSFFNKEKEGWETGTRQFTTFAWRRIVWYVMGYIRSAYIRHDGILPIAYLSAGRKGEDEEEHREYLETSLFEDPETVSEEVSVVSLIDMILGEMKKNGVQGYSSRRLMG